ncbi:uncharacterized protein KY384_003699 [Bacidia gigantensis]|uniref:uncharacterized protein n=1 Tax=Bacidia gigantensis TaxID=2732470 RepID=UPI001D04A72B|nr:uncharacterized protein KY384_003699 [Bacidia gigantensis]KAG8532062.1 hypothetical protein KY384_003699 [Bacidia gigantensis]
MALDLQQLSKALEASLDPTKNKQAEIALLQEEKKPKFALSLLQIVATGTSGDTARLASALYFKNLIKRRWVDENGKHKLPQNEVIAIKSELIGLMISVPPNVQNQLGDAISVIADSDFWERWDTLVDDLASRLTLDNSQQNNGVLQVAHSIFKRWRPLYRSDPLFIEINHVLGKFGTPFLSLIESTDRLISQSQNEQKTLRELFTTLNLIVKVFYDLSVQDLPPIFEDNLAAVTTFLHKYLVYENKLLDTNDDTEAGPLQLVKASILELLEMWVQKYEDAFGQHVAPFIESSWNLLTTVGIEVKMDILVSKALQFLTAVTHSAEHAQAFNNQNTLGQVVEGVILPNLNLRDSDVELFEDEPIEFIRRDLEGSDSDTRRRSAINFLRQLMAKFEALVGVVALRYIDHYLSEYDQDRSSNWKSKDTAVYLYSAVAAKGAITASQGVTSIHDFANVVDFFQRNIATELVADQGTPSILKVDAIKYLYTFRGQITAGQWQEAFPLLVKHLGSSEYVVYTYAAIALERTMALSNVSKQPVIGRSDVEGLAPQLLEHLFGLIERDSQPAKLQENEFLMRCIMRVLIVIKEGMLPSVETILLHLIKIIQVSCQNPSNPKFNYYLFEAVGALIRYSASTLPDKLETDLYSPFATVLQNDVQEFVPYVFQLFAALLEANPSGSLSEYYQSLIPPILNPTPWSSKGNVPALVRLVTAIIPRGANVMVQNNQLDTLLGIFQRLVSTKTNETYGFDMLESIISYIPQSALQQYYVIILQVLLTRLQSSRTDTFATRFVRLYHFISAKDDTGLGADFFISVADQVQAEEPPVPTTSDDVIVEQDPEDMSFGVGFTQLTTIRRPVRDQWPEIGDVKAWVSEYLKAADRRHNGTISTNARERLSAEVATAFAVYLQN